MSRRTLPAGASAPAPRGEPQGPARRRGGDHRRRSQPSGPGAGGGEQGPGEPDSRTPNPTEGCRSKALVRAQGGWGRGGRAGSHAGLPGWGSPPRTQTVTRVSSPGCLQRVSESRQSAPTGLSWNRRRGWWCLPPRELYITQALDKYPFN